ncbi:MAG: PAS domain S-box protein, partial [Polyangiaceae bacterium]
MPALKGSARPSNEDGASLDAQLGRLRELLDNVDDAVFLCDAVTADIAECNAGACALFGYTSTELTSTSMSALSAHEEGYTKERLARWFHDAIQHGKVRFEWRSRRRDGRFFWSEVRVTRSTLIAQSRVVVVVRDTSDLRASLEKLRLAETRYRLLVNHLPKSGLVLYDRDLRFVLVDGPEVEATGFTKASMEGRTLQEVLAPAVAERLKRELLRVFAGESFSAELNVGWRTF